ncbi:hypothetical protein ACHQM5_027551 [Ranunculus cassubicifolius]
MIDTLQQLGIDYHFQEQIDEALMRQYKDFIASGEITNSDNEKNLCSTSICFRLLRQNGHPVPSDVFNRFTDKHGKFRHHLSTDLDGMIGLYQASLLGMEGEGILDLANAFTSVYLRGSAKKWSQHQARIIKDIVDHPNHLTIARFNIKNVMKNQKSGVGSYDFNLQELARMDFNIVQALHNAELQQLVKWCRDLGISRKLDFARDQPVKWYMWSMTILADPMYTEERIDLTKCISFIYMMDDIFDVYGTLDELVLFDKAINKWEVDTFEQLSDPMKIYLKALYKTTEEISYKIFKKYGWNPISSIRKAWARLCKAFLVEAKWFTSGHLPTSEEYLKNGMISSGVDVLFVHIFFLLGQGINKETIDLIENIPGLVSYPATILRLWDDLGSSKDENQQGYDGSYIDCYMKEHVGADNDHARENVRNMISNMWKKLNQEYVSSCPFPLSFKKASLNTARMVRLMYSYDENQRLPMLEKHMKSVLYESIPPAE